MYDFIKDFQTLIAGILVLIGVVVTLWQNASVARKQCENQRNHQQNNLREALLAELKINHDALVDNWQQSKIGSRRDQDEEILIPTDIMNDNYLAHLNQIGILSRIEVNKVMYAYLALRASSTKLSLIGTPVDESRQYVRVRLALVTEMWKNLIEPLNQAIKSLEEHLEAQTG